MPITEVDVCAVLETGRLTLRPVAGGDLAHILELAGDIEVARWTTSIPHPLSGTQVQAWLAGRAAPGEHAFAVLPKDGSQLIGAVGITAIPGGDKGEIGFWIGRPYWGRGFATEAVRRMLLYGFGFLGLNVIEASVFRGNDRSARVLIKSGFKESGAAARAAPARGGDREVIVYTLTREDFARSGMSPDAGCR